MIHDNEILTLLLGVGCLHFIILKYADFRDNPAIGLLLPSFCMVLSAWLCSILEGFFFPAGFDFLEHLLYFASALCLFMWVVRLPLHREGSPD